MKPVDLSDVLSADWRDLGIRIDLCWRLRLGAPAVWGASISKRRETKGGNEGKSTHLLTLVASEGETPAELLRQVAIVLEHDGPLPMTGPE